MEIEEKRIPVTARLEVKCIEPQNRKRKERKIRSIHGGIERRDKDQFRFV